MKKIYLASPISKYVRNGMSEDYTSVIDKVYNLLNEYGETYYPLKKEAYGEDKISGSGEVCTKIDFEKVNGADLIVAFVEDSQGVSVEIGWASAAHKNVIIFIDKKYHQSELIRFIDTITPAHKIIINTSNGYKHEEEKILLEIKKYLEENHEI